MRFFFVLVAPLLLGACASAPVPETTVEGSTATGPLLREVAGQVMAKDGGKAAFCNEARHIRASLISADPPVTVVERWQVTRCASVASYRVIFRSGTTGTEFSVAEEASP